MLIKGQRSLALLCHGIVALGLLLAGLRYGLAPEPLTYHQQLLVTRFADLPAGEQALLLALLHGAGAAMISGALALLLLIFVPLRRGQRWAVHAVPALALSGLLPLLVITLHLRERGAATPWWAVSAAIALSVAGWAQSRLSDA